MGVRHGGDGALLKFTVGCWIKFCVLLVVSVLEFYCWLFFVKI